MCPPGLWPPGLKRPHCHTSGHPASQRPRSPRRPGCPLVLESPSAPGTLGKGTRVFLFRKEAGCSGPAGRALLGAGVFSAHATDSEAFASPIRAGDPNGHVSVSSAWAGQGFRTLETEPCPKTYRISLNKTKPSLPNHVSEGSVQRASCQVAASAVLCR